MKSLETVVRDIATTSPEGLRHVDFVDRVLHSGYTMPKDSAESLSQAVHRVLKRMVRTGVLARDDDHREYAVAELCCGH
jgi:hypothetical protein